jgi:hypothetical protein
MSISEKWREEDKVLIKKIVHILKNTYGGQHIQAKKDIQELVKSIARDRKRALKAQYKASSKRTKGRGAYPIDAQLIPTQFRPNPIYITEPEYYNHLHMDDQRSF